MHKQKKKMKILILRLKFFLFLFFPFFWVPEFVCVEQAVVIMNGGQGGGATWEKEVEKKENLSYHYTPDVNAREPWIKAFDAVVNGPAQDGDPAFQECGSGNKRRPRQSTSPADQIILVHLKILYQK